jgi:hypothetical protein
MTLNTECPIRRSHTTLKPTLAMHLDNADGYSTQGIEHGVQIRGLFSMVSAQDAIIGEPQDGGRSH